MHGDAMDWWERGFGEGSVEKLQREILDLKHKRAAIMDRLVDKAVPPHEISTLRGELYLINDQIKHRERRLRKAGLYN